MTEPKQNYPPPPARQDLFTLAIPPCDDHPGGTITATQPLPAHYLLTITSPPDNRLTTALCTTLLQALDILEHHPCLPPGVVITTSALPKFYSNGLDLAHAIRIGDPFWTRLWALYRRLLTYPMPTVALVNGHAFAGGFMLAMHHDYRVMNPARGFACLNELDFGAPLKPPMSAIFRCKLPDPRSYREMVLEARRFGGKEALAKGIVDQVGGWEEVVALAGEKKLMERGRTGVYGLLKMEMYRECLDLLENHHREEEKDGRWVSGEQARKEQGKREVEVWARITGKGKL